VAEEVVLGVDTHKDVHVAAVLTTLGVLLSTKNFPATAAGYQALLDWVGTFGVLRRAGVECTGSYGAALARHLRAAGVTVIEVNQPDKACTVPKLDAWPLTRRFAGRARLLAGTR
jgi:transposase